MRQDNTWTHPKFKKKFQTCFVKIKTRLIKGWNETGTWKHLYTCFIAISTHPTICTYLVTAIMSIFMGWSIFVFLGVVDINPVSLAKKKSEIHLTLKPKMEKFTLKRPNSPLRPRPLWTAICSLNLNARESKRKVSQHSISNGHPNFLYEWVIIKIFN